jgi:hypothetical protein
MAYLDFSRGRLVLSPRFSNATASGPFWLYRLVAARVFLPPDIYHILIDFMVRRF